MRESHGSSIESIRSSKIAPTSASESILGTRELGAYLTCGCVKGAWRWEPDLSVTWYCHDKAFATSRTAELPSSFVTRVFGDVSGWRRIATK